MDMIFNEIKYETPFRLGAPVLQGSGKEGAYNRLAVDCPFVFYHNDRTYMMHVGFDGTGYQTALSSSENPCKDFQTEGLILRAGDGNGWDSLNAAGTWILCEDDLQKTRKLKKYQGKYWLTYHSYPGEGYETGPASIGIAYCEDEDLLHWTRLEEPILIADGGASWECGGLYKSCIIQNGDTFTMFYNAKTSDESWIEQTGIAFSADLIHWSRYEMNPVLSVSENSFDSKFASDPCVVKDGDFWLMFYFGYDGKHAMDSLAYSKDLLTWQKINRPLLPCGPESSLDSLHAHKPNIYFYEGILYHYYCACREALDTDFPVNTFGDFRCITVAANRKFS